MPSEPGDGGGEGDPAAISSPTTHLTLNRTAGLEDSGTKAALTPTQLRLEGQICHRTEKACKEKTDRLTLPFVGKTGTPRDCGHKCRGIPK